MHVTTNWLPRTKNAFRLLFTWKYFSFKIETVCNYTGCTRYVQPYQTVLGDWCCIYKKNFINLIAVCNRLWRFYFESILQLPKLREHSLYFFSAPTSHRSWCENIIYKLYTLSVFQSTLIVSNERVCPDQIEVVFINQTEYNMADFFIAHQW